MKIVKSLFGTVEGNEVYRFDCTNGNGNSVSIINYGATVISWLVKDNKNLYRDIVLGFENLEDYLHNDIYLGCIVGRYANRIAHGKFKIEDAEYQLACNNSMNHLHGGYKGFDKVVWDAEIDPAETKLSLVYVSKDGEEGYPGNLKVKVVYTYTNDDELQIEYFAETDKTTPINLTNHCYFNLTGDAGKNILDHSLQVNATGYTVVDENQVTTGEISGVADTGLDFKDCKKISENFGNTSDGFDHNYVLNHNRDELALAALLCDPENEVKMYVYTTEPGIQFYSGNLLDGRFTNRDGKPMDQHSALCLETQHYPDSPNHAHFPSTILNKGEKFNSKTVYKITVT